MTWPLLERFPKLRFLTPANLCHRPTPVERLALPNAFGYVKRDDVSAPHYGGNKMRKLEWILADLRRNNTQAVVTLGATGTNAGLATALLCEQENLRCHIHTFPQPDSPVVSQNRQRMREAGAILHDHGSLFRAALAWQLSPKRLWRDHYFLYAGCSNPVATLAYVDAMLELKQQVDQGLCPAPKHIVVACGSGATAAGMVVGNHISGLNATIHAVQVAPSRLGPFQVCSEKLVQHMACQCALQLELSPQNYGADALHWHTEQYGNGYGHSSAASEEALHVGQQLGLRLENTYTGKAFATYLTLAEQHPGCLFWHTFSSRQAEVSQNKTTS